MSSDKRRYGFAVRQPRFCKSTKLQRWGKADMAVLFDREESAAESSQKWSISCLPLLSDLGWPRPGEPWGEQVDRRAQALSSKPVSSGEQRVPPTPGRHSSSQAVCT